VNRARQRATAKGESEKEEGRSQLMDDQDGDDVAKRTNKRRKKKEERLFNEQREELRRVKSGVNESEGREANGEAKGRIRILAFFKFNSTIFPEKVTFSFIFPRSSNCKFKNFAFWACWGPSQARDTDDAHAFDLLTRCRAT
jgi:hypothetical protein